MLVIVHGNGYCTQTAWVPKICRTALILFAFEKSFSMSSTSGAQDINAVDEAKKNLAARGNPMPDDWCKVVQMRAARA